MVFKSNKKILSIILLMFISFSFFGEYRVVYAKIEVENISGTPVVYLPLEKNYQKGVTISPKYIIIHDTGNRGVGANARANRNYFNTTDREASTQFIVDDKEIVQALPSNAMAWHIGDAKGKTNATNSNSIGIELCVNSDGDFGATFQNGINLTKYLMKLYNIPAENVIRHYDVSKKICPRIMIEDDPSLWVRFENEISEKTTIVETINPTINIEEKTSNYKTPLSPNARLVEGDVDVKLLPSKDTKTVDIIKQGSFVEVIDKIGDNYCKITYNDIEGYIPIDNVKLFEEYKYDKDGYVVKGFNTRKTLVKILSFGVINEDIISR